MIKYLQSIDIAILEFIQKNIHNKILDVIMPIITSLGDHGTIWIVIAIILLLFKKHRRTGYLVTFSLVLSWILGDFILKPLFQRPRPFEIIQTISLLIDKPESYSFPSVHTLIGFSVGGVLAKTIKKYGWVFMVLASLIAFSRLYLGVHYASDIVAGMFFGMFCVILTLKFFADIIDNKKGKGDKNVAMPKVRIKQLLMFIFLGLIFVVLCKFGTYYFILFTLACVIYGFIEPYLIEIKESAFSDVKIPHSFDNYKILFISDIHLSPAFSRNRLKSVVKKVNSFNPDLVLIGGDYVDKKDYIKACFDELKELKSQFGMYGVLGNHDHWAGAEKVKAAMEQAGIHCLDNQAVWIKKADEAIKLGGVGDYWNDVQDLQPTISDVTSDDFVIILSHNPDFAEGLKTEKINLVLSGHTHGGQGTIFGCWAPFVPSDYGQKYRTGIIETPNTKVLISHGLGNVAYFPIRFFARPQINIIHLKHE